MNVEHAILHEIITKSGEQKVDIKCREAENVLNNDAKNLCHDVNSLFRKTGLSTGGFSAVDGTKLPFETLLSGALSETNDFNDFVAFSQSVAKLLQKQLQKKTAIKANGAYLWLNSYTYHNESFLTLVMLKEKKAMRIAELELSEFDSINLDKLHMAARINVTRWLNGDHDRYISFKIGKDAQGVTNYFADFVGCEEFTAQKLDSQNFVQVTNLYCKGHGFDNQKTELAKNHAYEWAIKSIEDGKPLCIDKVSESLDLQFAIEDDKKGLFLETAQNANFNLNNELSLEKASLKGLMRFFGKNKSMSISFDSSLISDGKIIYKNGILTIKHLPDTLKKQLEEIA